MRAHAAGEIWATALRPTVIYGDRDRQFVPRVARLLSRGIVPLVGGGVSKFSIVHAANVADGVVRAATRDAAAGGRTTSPTTSTSRCGASSSSLGQGLGRRIRFVRLPTPVARGALRAVKAITRALTGGKMSVVSSASLAWLTRDNPFTSERARAELGGRRRCAPKPACPTRSAGGASTADGTGIGKQKGATGGGRAHVTPKGEAYGFFFVVSFFVVSIVILLLSIFIPVSGRRGRRERAPSRAASCPLRRFPTSSMQRQSRAQRQRKPGAS